MKTAPYIKEACVESVDQALQAEFLRADRIELCANLDVGGTTPAPNIIKEAVRRLNIPVRVMIRPRGGNFVYDDVELQQMKSEIMFCKQYDVEGVVFGILNADRKLDVDLIKELTVLANPMRVVIHKAIDETPDIKVALKQLLDLNGISTILTSGSAVTAARGKKALKEMIQLSQDKIEVMPAGGITDNNVGGLHTFLHARAYHGKRIVGDLS